MSKIAWLYTIGSKTYKNIQTLRTMRVLAHPSLGAFFSKEVGIRPPTADRGGAERDRGGAERDRGGCSEGLWWCIEGPWWMQ